MSKLLNAILVGDFITINGHIHGQNSFCRNYARAIPQAMADVKFFLHRIGFLDCFIRATFVSSGPSAQILEGTMPAKKRVASRAKRGSSSKGGILFTENAIVITLDAATKRRAMLCLKITGKITFAVKEHSVTRLPQILDNGKLSD